MNKDEKRAYLEGLGVPIGKWERARSEEIRIDRIEKQRAMYESLKRLLQAQVESDLNRLSELQISLSLLKKAQGLKDGGE
jgi:hypothetical protein